MRDRPGPSATQLRRTLGRAYVSWTALTGYVRDHYRVTEDWSREDDGWTLRLRKGGKSLLTLATNDRWFDAQFVVPPARVEEALALDLREGTRSLIRAARPYPDGRWIRIPVRVLRDIADIERLVAFKAGR